MRAARPLAAAVLGLLLVLVPAASRESQAASGRKFPNILIVTVDTLRADFLSSYGFERLTSPVLDELMARGVRFTQARTPEPLTAPAFASMFTTLPPHEHGATRNGLRMRTNLPSLTKILQRRTYATAAVVSNWTLQDRLLGLGEHFEHYREVLTRKRWLFMLGEATAQDVNERAIDWLDDQVEDHPDQPFLLWVHYVEPHAPYRLQKEFLEQLGRSPNAGVFSPTTRYETEVAYVDHAIGELLESVAERIDLDETLVIFTSDHGESLGEHSYWGHGRHLYDASLRVPLAFVWPGRIEPGVIDAPALITDIPATIFGLAGFPQTDALQGLDWSPVMRGEIEPPIYRVTYYQAHRGSVKPREKQERIRRRGLLEVGRMEGLNKEIVQVKERDARLVFDVAQDPTEEKSVAPLFSATSEPLASWRVRVEEGLLRSDSLPPPSLSEEDLDELRALGYVD